MLLGLYLEALDEELVALQSSIGTHKPTSILKVEGLEEETQSGEGQTEVGEQDDTVRQFFSFCLLSSVSLMYKWI